MKYFAAVALAAIANATTDASNHWAVIMAGSNTYGNYRHQADSHHAVKIMLENGIPRDQIIHLAYDDVAENFRNPYKGQLFNKPTASGTPGVNVYDQSEIDYSGSEVSKANFLAVLTGDAETATGPVLQSDENSHVFVYFVDHGGAGLICTPQGSSDWIYADELDAALQTMYDNSMFAELTFYLEACESGSMFPNLTKYENIYAMTASNASLSSWAAYCGSEATVDGVSIGSCLGDLFSINWMEDTEANNPDTETLLEQQSTVIELTSASPVQTFGTTDFLWEAIGDFQGIQVET
jgi:legumain